jgi:hypothetical protein
MQNNINVDINQTVPVICEQCNGIYFEQSLTIRKVSGILTGQAEASYIPIPVFQCKACGHVNSEFQPKKGKALE